MRTELIRVYKSVHTWAGIISGMALFICFYAGALTVFKEPLTRWASPPAIESAVPLGDAQNLITQTLRANPDAARGFTIHLQENEARPARMSWQLREKGADEHDEASVRHFIARLDAQGSAVVQQSHPTQLAAFIDVLHRVVGLPVDNDPNRWVMGVFAVLYALALVSGVIVLLPSLVKDFFAIRVGQNRKRMWLDAHNVVGIVSLPFHIVIALTAVVFAYHDGIYALQNRLLHDGKMSAAFQGPKPLAGVSTERDPATMLAPLELVARAQALVPSFEPTSLQYQQATGPRASVRVWGKDSSAVMPRARGGFAALDPYTGKVLSTDFLPGRQSAPNLLISSFFALHMAAFGGTAVQWMYFLLGMSGAWLFFSGNLLWIESRRRKANRDSAELPIQRRDVRVLASLTVGVCLGCVCGISLLIASSKWMLAFGGNTTEALAPIYYAAFFTSIAWSFFRGPARAAIHLLWAAVLLTLAIPLTTLLAWLVPSLGLWGHSTLVCLGVDLTALIAAFAFAWIARGVSRRASTGPKDSVWSLSTSA